MKNIKPQITFIIIGILGRLVPHIPNFTPIASMSLFAGSNLSKKSSYLTIFVTLLFSDAVLGYFQNHHMFSNWTFFTYTGFAAIIFLGSKIPKNHVSSWLLLIYILSSSLLFWFWTNFGVWLAGNIYPKNFFGLMTCYTMALPFLRNEILGDVIWAVAIFGTYNLYSVYHRKQINITCNS